VRPFWNATAKRIERGILARDIGVRLSLVSVLVYLKALYLWTEGEFYHVASYVLCLFIYSGNRSAPGTKRDNVLHMTLGGIKP
jgi:hypothetical protein